MLFLACNILIASPARSLSWQEKEKEESNEVPCAVQKISCPQHNSTRWRRFLPLVLCLIFFAFCRIFFFSLSSQPGKTNTPLPGSMGDRGREISTVSARV